MVSKGEEDNMASLPATHELHIFGSINGVDFDMVGQGTGNPNDGYEELNLKSTKGDLQFSPWILVPHIGYGFHQYLPYPDGMSPFQAAMVDGSGYQVHRTMQFEDGASLTVNYRYTYEGSHIKGEAQVKGTGFPADGPVMTNSLTAADWCRSKKTYPNDKTIISTFKWSYTTGNGKRYRSTARTTYTFAKPMAANYLKNQPMYVFRKTELKHSKTELNFKEWQKAFTDVMGMDELYKGGHMGTGSTGGTGGVSKGEEDNMASLPATHELHIFGSINGVDFDMVGQGTGNPNDGYEELNLKSTKGDLQFSPWILVPHIGYGFHQYLPYPDGMSPFQAAMVDGSGYQVHRTMQFEDGASLTVNYRYTYEGSHIKGEAQVKGTGFPADGPVMTNSLTAADWCRSKKTYPNDKTIISTFKWSYTTGNGKRYRSTARTTYTFAKPMAANYLKNQPMYVFRKTELKHSKTELNFKEWQKAFTDVMGMDELYKSGLESSGGTGGSGGVSKGEEDNMASLPATHELHIFGSINGVDFDMVGQGTGNPNDGYEELNLKSTKGDLQFSPWILVPHIGYGFHQYLPYPDGMSPFQAAMVDGSGYQVHRTMQFEDGASLTVNYRYTYEGSHIKGEAQVKGTGFPADGPVMTNSLTAADWCRSKKTYPNDKTIISTFKWSYTTGNGKRYRSTARTTYTFAKPMAANYLKNQPMYVFRKTELKHSKTELNFKEWQKAFTDVMGMDELYKGGSGTGGTASSGSGGGVSKGEEDNMASLPATHELHIFGSINGVDFDMVGQGTGNPNDGYEELNLKSTKGDLQFSPWILVPHIGYGFHQYLPYPDGMSPFQAAMVDGSGYQVHRTMQFEDGASLTVNYRYTYEGSHIKGEAQVKGTGFPADGPVMTNSLTAADWCRSKKTYPNDKTIISTFKWSYTTGNGKRYRSTARTTYTFAKPMAANYLKNQPMYVFRKTELKHSKTELNFKEWQKAFTDVMGMDELYKGGRSGGGSGPRPRGTRGKGRRIRRRG
nr:mNeonGreen4-tDeg [Cloning vector pminiCMV-mNeonGreen4-tDeg]QEM23465.1 mNeonGreen4-tDeg [Cloning vector pUbC-mNeonGreen4-tDeg]